jgi:hypothetical protein
MTASVVAARSWRPALALAAVFGFACGALLTSNAVAALAGALVAVGVLAAIGGTSTLQIDDNGITHSQLGRSRRIEWSEVTRVVCWVRRPWGGRVPPLRIEVTATGQQPSPGLALPVSLRVDLIRRATAQRAAVAIQEQAARAGVPATVEPWG